MVSSRRSRRIAGATVVTWIALTAPAPAAPPTVTSGANAFPGGIAAFGPVEFSVTAPLALVSDAGGFSTTDGCEAPVTGVSGAIALVDRGICSFPFKAANVQAGGAVAIVIVNNAASANPPSIGGSAPGVTVPTTSVTQAAGTVLKTLVSNSATVARTLTSELSTSAAALGFGSVPLGSIGPSQDLTITNLGDKPLALTRAFVTGATPADFIVASDPCSATTIAPLASCHLRLRFAPEALGASDAQLSFMSDATTSSPPVDLAGTGIAAAPGPTGPPGTPGSKGGIGARGPAGPRGLPGRDGKVRCRVRAKRKVRCVVTFRAPGAKRAVLRRDGHAVTRSRVRHGRVRLVAAPGRYVLRVTYRDGRVRARALRLR